LDDEDLEDRMRVPLMAGNWKMNLDHDEAAQFIQLLERNLTTRGHHRSKVEVALLPPYTDLRTVQMLVADEHYKLVYGAQDVSAHVEGAYTGEISAGMLNRAWRSARPANTSRAPSHRWTTR
jgi:triosephosphate isomerase (TIM)